MATAAPTTSAPIDATLIPTSLVDRAVSLQSTAAYIETLLEVVGATLRDLRRHNNGCANNVNGIADWRQLEILLNLAGDQAAIVLDVARALEHAELDQVTRSIA